MEKITVSLDEIENKTVQALIKHGAETWIAAEVGKAVRLAEATKNIICGLYYLKVIACNLFLDELMEKLFHVFMNQGLDQFW